MAIMQRNTSEHSLDTTASPKGQPVASRVSPWLMSLLYPLGRFAVLPFYFGRIEVTGQEHLPNDGPVILAPSHRSRWDALIVPYAAGRHVTGRHPRFMVSADEVQGLQGWFIRRLGGFPVNIKQPGISSLRHGVELLLNRQMLVIFPEGGIFRDGQLHRLKPGLARIAMQAESSQPGLGAKIVPVSIRYGQLIPGWGCGVSIHIGEPLQVADYCCQESTKQSAQKLTDALEAAIKQLDAANDISHPVTGNSWELQPQINADAHR
ncbi:lysophospholipid acyltransferase family protein [Kamptonema formosum]|uniref:lysophospholipid acyltransferase family protein n=1 Tax=Kamptonema formosum TaxID=331992 RepID=UPI000344B16B